MADLRKGVSFAEALADVPSEWIRNMRVDFAGARNDELRAALVLMAFSGTHFKLHDKDGRQGAVDFVADIGCDQIDLAEVTSTLCDNVVKQLEFFKKLPARTIEFYKGRVGWLLSFKDGWAAPLGGKERHTLPEMIARELEKLARGDREFADLESVPWIRAVKTSEPEASIRTIGMSCISSDLNGTYVERLAQFLASSDLMKRKVSKLERASKEQWEVQTSSKVRTHLYLNAPFIGGFSDLSPFPFEDPGRFDGTFDVSPSLNDIWLDSWSRYVYHWSAESGWSEHSLGGYLSFHGDQDIFDQIEGYLA